MLISKKYKFVFCKQQRTAGTSSEKVLYGAVGRGDVLIRALSRKSTLLHAFRHYFQGRPAVFQNIEFPVSDNSPIRGRPIRIGHISFSLLAAHDDSRLKRFDISGYDKIINVRNPFEQEYSLFTMDALMQKRLGREDLESNSKGSLRRVTDLFTAYLRSRAEEYRRTRQLVAELGVAGKKLVFGPFSDLDRYWYQHDGKEIEYQHIIRFENYEDDVQKVFRHYDLGYKGTVYENPFIQTKIRQPKSKYFSDESIELVREIRSYSIEKFGY